MPITYIRGSLFDAPRGSYLLHATNTSGEWSGGIARAFKSRYPSIYEYHRDYCINHNPSTLLGTTQLIETGSGIRVACLFTSQRGGRRCDSIDRILEATEKGLVDFKRQIENSKDVRIAACRFNSGIFRVPWEDTVQVIEQSGLSMDVYLP